jgi:hypothetical protein
MPAVSRWPPLEHFCELIENNTSKNCTLEVQPMNVYGKDTKVVKKGLPTPKAAATMLISK